MAVACVAEAARSGGGARNALVLGLTAAEEERLAALGALRSISHVGWAVGAVGGAVIIGVDSRPATSRCCSSTPRQLPRLRGAGGERAAGRCRAPPRAGCASCTTGPYVTLAALIGVLALCWAMLSSGLPLWVALHTDAPRSISAVIVVLNSLAIALARCP